MRAIPRRLGETPEHTRAVAVCGIQPSLRDGIDCVDILPHIEMWVYCRCVPPARGGNRIDGRGKCSVPPEGGGNRADGMGESICAFGTNPPACRRHDVIVGPGFNRGTGFNRGIDGRTYGPGVSERRSITQF